MPQRRQKAHSAPARAAEPLTPDTYAACAQALLEAAQTMEAAAHAWRQAITTENAVGVAHARLKGVGATLDAAAALRRISETADAE